MPRARKGAQRASVDQNPGSFAPSANRSRRPRRGTRALLRAIAVSLPALALLPLAALPVAAHADGPATDRRIAPRLHPGGVLVDHGIRVTVPARGGFVWGELKLPDGTWQEVSVETAVDGTVSVSRRGDERAATLAQRYAAASRGASGATDASTAVERAAAPAATNECVDAFKNLYPWRTPDLEWRFNPAGTPAYLLDPDGSTASVEAALQRAQDNITGSVNRCGRSDAVRAKGSFIGQTGRTPDVSGAASCLGGDGRSVIGFGSLPSYSIAMTCVYGSVKGVAAEADIRINSESTRWAVDKASCKGRQLLIEAAMTHEFGHAYGLAHASTFRDPRLTMQPLIPACSQGPSTLGLGDMLGLEKKY